MSSILCIVMSLCFCCADDDNEPNVADNVVVSDVLYGSATSEHFQIIDAQIQGDDLKLSMSSSGCDGSTWIGTLIIAELVAESLPPQRGMRFVLDNHEVCDAVPTRTFTFDLTPAQVEGESIVLHLDGWSDPLLYEY